MAREVRILTWCDNTKKHGDETDVAAEPLPPITIGGKPRQLDLCAECRVELVEPLRALLETEGRALDPADDLICSECDAGPFKNERGLRAHQGIKHGTHEQQALAFEPTEPPPADDDQQTLVAEVATDYTCPDCGKQFARSQGLGAHRARSHGYRAGDDT